MPTNGNIERHHERASYHCRTATSLLGIAETDELILRLSHPASREQIEERDKLLDLVRTVNRRHQYFHIAFPAAVFRDANWTIILACFTALLEGKLLCVKHIQSLVDDSHTAVLRHIDTLEAHGLIGRRRDSMDGRRTLVLLSGHGATAMTRYLTHFPDDDEWPGPQEMRQRHRMS